MDQDLVEAQNLARRLHLGILRGPPFFPQRQFCMTVQCGCDCEDCQDLRALMTERGFRHDGQIDLLHAEDAPAQPWDIERAA